MSTAPVMLMQFKITEYEMTGMGLMKYSLGIQVQQSKGKIFISREKYLEDLLKWFPMSNCKPISTPLATNEKLQQNDGAPKEDV